jgi:hypothetical protein
METSQMKLQAILSSVALVAAMSFSGAAVAQNIIGDVAIPEEQMDAFKDACTALQAKSTASLTSTDTEDSAVDETETGSTGNDDSGQSDSPDPASQDYWDSLFAGLTLDDCKAAGL